MNRGHAATVRAVNRRAAALAHRLARSGRSSDPVANAARRWAPRAALTYGGRTLTYAELDRTVEAAVRGYRSLGLGQGQLVACQLPNGIECVVAACAARRLGAVHVAIDPYLTGSELVQAIDQVGCAALIRQLPGSTALFDPDAPRAQSAPSGPARRMAATAFSPHRSEPLLADPVAIAREIVRQGHLVPADVHLAHLPLTGCPGLSLAMAALLTGGHLVVLERFSGDAALSAIAAHSVTVVSGSAEQFRSLERARLETVRVAVAALQPMPLDTVRSLLDTGRRAVVAIYCSASGLIACTSNRADLVAGSVGRPRAGSAAIVNRDGNVLPPGEAGEIVGMHRGLSACRTGDLGWLDDEGRLHVIGPRHRQIFRTGVRIDPVPIESALLRCDQIRDAAVIGIPNQVLGEAVCACVVPSLPQRPSLASLWPGLGNRLPDQLCLVRSIPRTRLGQVDVGCLRAYVLESPREMAPFRYA